MTARRAWPFVVMFAGGALAGCTLLLDWSELVKPCAKHSDCTEGFHCSDQSCVPGYPEQPDASVALDEDASVPDAFTVADAAPPPDAFVPDAFVADAFVADASVADASVADAGVADASVADASVADAAVADAATADASEADAAITDAGSEEDAGAEDAGLDASMPDAADAG